MDQALREEEGLPLESQAQKVGERPLVLFDGDCVLCSGAVAFILARDKDARFRFASLQSPAGRRVLEAAGHSAGLETMVLREDGRLFFRSDAALRIARGLDGAWPLAYALRVVPRPLRDAVYALIARNRYRWFGKRESCLVPAPELRDRFLE